MKVMKKGEAHLIDMWDVHCPYCESTIRIMEGDPMMYKEWNGFNNIGYILRYICPICQSNVEETLSLSDSNKRVIRRQDVKMDEEDRKEKESWVIGWEAYKDMDAEDRDFLHAYRFPH